MSLTPGARAYGAVDDFFDGAINRMGWQIEPGATIMATWGSKETNLADALKAPALVLNVYAPPSAADDTFDQYLFDVLWGSTGAELEEFGVQITGELARNLPRRVTSLVTRLVTRHTASNGASNALLAPELG